VVRDAVVDIAATVRAGHGGRGGGRTGRHAPPGTFRPAVPARGSGADDPGTTWAPAASQQLRLCAFQSSRSEWNPMMVMPQMSRGNCPPITAGGSSLTLGPPWPEADGSTRDDRHSRRNRVQHRRLWLPRSEDDQLGGDMARVNRPGCRGSPAACVVVPLSSDELSGGIGVAWGSTTHVVVVVFRSWVLRRASVSARR
jgi:hypothetical protein